MSEKSPTLTKKQKAVIGLLAGWSCDTCEHQKRQTFNIGKMGPHEVRSCVKTLTPSQYGWCSEFCSENHERPFSH